MDDNAFPAPGSAAPGAPPPLRRALTEADGLAVRAPEPFMVPPARQENERTSTARLVLVLGGIALGLELAHLLGGRRAGKAG